MTLSVCCHSKILLLWQRYETTSPLYFNQGRFFLGGGGGAGGGGGGEGPGGGRGGQSDLENCAYL